MLTKQQKDAAIKVFGPDLGKTILHQAEPTPGKTIIKLKMPDLPAPVTPAPADPTTHFFGKSAEKMLTDILAHDCADRQRVAVETGRLFNGQKAKPLEEMFKCLK